MHTRWSQRARPGSRASSRRRRCIALPSTALPATAAACRRSWTSIASLSAHCTAAARTSAGTTRLECPQVSLRAVVGQVCTSRAPSMPASHPCSPPPSAELASSAFGFCDLADRRDAKIAQLDAQIPGVPPLVGPVAATPRVGLRYCDGPSSAPKIDEGCSLAYSSRSPWCPRRRLRCRHLATQPAADPAAGCRRRRRACHSHAGLRQCRCTSPFSNATTRIPSESTSVTRPCLCNRARCHANTQARLPLRHHALVYCVVLLGGASAAHQGEQHILRLDVTVHDSLCVQVSQTDSDVARDTAARRLVHGAINERVGQHAAVDVLHAQENFVGVRRIDHLVRLQSVHGEAALAGTRASGPGAQRGRVGSDQRVSMRAAARAVARLHCGASASSSHDLLINESRALPVPDALPPQQRAAKHLHGDRVHLPPLLCTRCRTSPPERRDRTDSFA